MNVVIAIGLVVMAVFLMRFIGGEFIPQSDQDFISVDIELPPGTTLKATDTLVSEVEETFKASQDVKDVLTVIGKSAGGFDEGVEFARMLIVLHEGHEKHVSEINAELRTLVDGKFPDVSRQHRA